MPFDTALRGHLDKAREIAVAALLAERNPAGHWVGELSASALSTATAVTALTLVARGDPVAAGRLRGAIERGHAWLVRNQNADGGWGDTTRSFSNISTTTLVWAALGLVDGRGAVSLRPPAGESRAQQDCAPTLTRTALAAAEGWLTRAAGSIEPAQLVGAIERRYGDDRTFSIPILTMCALCGRLGPGREGWRHVRQLPFEIAALPQRWFGALRLPVVSYALPALIAIGQVRHGLRPTRNPVLRALRERVRASTLEKLSRLQPENGGFLEATPLTSFVTMSLAALDLTAHPVVQRGVAFLEASARDDGSWPIDTNLATWVTTLSVNALAGDGCDVARRVSGGTGSEEVGDAPGRSRAGLPRAAADAIRDWLLGQQFRNEHPYTLAAPGGWAWTDLPGGVPDADDTAGALLALRQLDAGNPAVRSAAEAGVGWLLGLQNRDGGMPTFCRGWGKLPFDRSSPDLTAHAIRAWLAWRAELPAARQGKLDTAIQRAMAFLRKTQRADGAWIPLWFGHQEDAADENPLYGTARVVPALCLLARSGETEIESSLERAWNWLVTKQNADGGWSGAAGAASSMEETALAMEALAAAWENFGVCSPAFRRNGTATVPGRIPTEATGDGRGPRIPSEGGTTNASRVDLQRALGRGAGWLVAAIEHEAWRTPTPIGFYFAKLWYHERLYPLIFATGALTRLR